MGQIISAFKICRDAVKSLRGPKNSDCYLELDDDEQPNVSSSKERGLSGSGEGTSNFLCHAAIMEPCRTGLPGLPTEILLMNTEILPPSSLMSMSYSCRTIRNKMGLSIEHLLGKKMETAQLSPLTLYNNLPKEGYRTREGFRWSLPIVEPNVRHSERLELLCMLDRDQMIPPSKAICSGCAGTHDRSLFSSRSLAQSSSERLCLGRDGRVWICPHWIFDHNLLTTSAEPQPSHLCGGIDVFALAHESEPKTTLRFPLLTFRCRPSKQVVKHVLARLDPNVCKHLRFSDAFVSRLYSPDCKKLRDTSLLVQFCRCSMCVWQLSEPHLARRIVPPLPSPCSNFLPGGECESCGAEVYFETEWDGKDGEVLFLVLNRRIRSFRGCTDPARIEQVTDVAEFEGLERRWYAAINREVERVQDEVPAP